MGLAENTENFVAKPHENIVLERIHRREKKQHVKETNFLRPHHGGTTYIVSLLEGRVHSDAEEDQDLCGQTTSEEESIMDGL